MGKCIDLYTSLHQSTPRTYVDRMIDEKVHCMQKAKQYEFDYWDGDRRYGYGGYSYDGRWRPLAEKLIENYALNNDSKLLDVGCGKAYLLFEVKKILPDIEICGFDVSNHAINDAPSLIRDDLFVGQAQEPYKWDDNYYDLVISLGVLHNLKIFDLQSALLEIERVGKDKYVMVESFRDEQELFNLQCWALTCEAFYERSEWTWLFQHFGYTGDYEFIYFE